MPAENRVLDTELHVVITRQSSSASAASEHGAMVTVLKHCAQSIVVKIDCGLTM